MEFSETEAKSSPRFSRRAVIGGGVAIAISGAALALAKRDGLGTVGSGGVNQQLLPRAGDDAPDVTVSSIIGKRTQLSTLRGTAVWLNFWGSWCPPCRSEMPDIQAAYQQLEPTGIRLLAISLGESALDATIFAARNQVTFPIYSDPNREDTGAHYPIYNFPTHIFIDRNGVVRYVVLSELSTEEAVDYATKTLNIA